MSACGEKCPFTHLPDDKLYEIKSACENDGKFLESSGFRSASKTALSPTYRPSWDPEKPAIFNLNHSLYLS
jgi:hypothetical protein